MILLVTYDLHKPDRDYADVTETIKQSGTYCHIEESVWLIETDDSPAVWRDRLKNTAYEATYFVVQLRHNWAGSQLDGSVSSWLKNSRDW